MADNDKSFGKKVSLYEMLEKNSEDIIHKILIPKIQRDYAQGRDSASAIRERFLGSLFEAIDKDSGKELLLDFVFGQKEEKTRNIFYPVDGQQRLTTLFLLHLYVGKRGGLDVDFLKKFSYETRTSSKQFCERLHDIPADAYCGIRQYIDVQWWFTGLWRSDPTIKAMINMLDDIDRHYRQLNYGRTQFETVWKNLTANVKFWRLYLSDLDTTDELYIKMNSRGKLLTDFEHFKAMLDEYAQTKGRLSAEIDTEWTNLLWRYRDPSLDFDSEKYVDNGLDRCFTNLLIYFLNIEGSKLGLIDYQYPEKDILKLADRVLGFHPEKDREYTEDELMTCQREKAAEAEKIMSRFEKILNFFSKKDSQGNYENDPTTFFSRFIKTEYDWWNVDIQDIDIPDDVKIFIGNRVGVDLLREVCTKGLLTNEPNIYVEAFFEFAASNENITPDDFKERLRILRNLVANTEIHARDFKNTLILTDHIIATGETTKDGVDDEFNKRQKEQEQYKIDWMANNCQYCGLLKMIENHWLIMGNINVLLIDEENGRQNIDLIALERFGHLFHSRADYYKIESALLTYGDYSPTPVVKKVKSYGGKDWWQWQGLTQSFNRTTPVVIQRFLNDNNDYATQTLDILISRFKNDKTRGSFPWSYYMAVYDAVNTAPKAKYRYMGGEYSYYKLNANGGGGPEYYWNPYNLAIEGLIKPAINCVTHCYGGALTLTDKQIEVDVKEHDIEVKYPDGTAISIPIKQNEMGIDMVDRIAFAADECRRILDEYTNYC